MRDIEYLKSKRIKILEEIKPICEAFRIKDYDYEIDERYGSEWLRIEDTIIGCTCNSTSAVITELVGYIFIRTWRDRYLGAFETQTKNVIKEHWRK